MARELKTNGIYGITCTITGEAAGTTPAVFEKRAKMYGVTVETLKASYVGRTGAKLIKDLVTNQGKSPSDAVELIREAFGVPSDSLDIDDAILNKILESVQAKVDAKAAQAEFDAKKAAAILALTTPAVVFDDEVGDAE
tara:strand:- start:5991 stop:6407 length:417 start_codon:yes stop_codon:yes gene_type:complete